MIGLVYSLGISRRVFVIPHNSSYLCPDWKQYRYDNTTFLPYDDDIQVGSLELVTWLD